MRRLDPSSGSENTATRRDRIQVVKGWIDAKGELHERVHDVAWSGDRKAGSDGKIPSVGSTVDLANAT